MKRFLFTVYLTVAFFCVHALASQLKDSAISMTVGNHTGSDLVSTIKSQLAGIRFTYDEAVSNKLEGTVKVTTARMTVGQALQLLAVLGIEHDFSGNHILLKAVKRLRGPARNPSVAQRPGRVSGKVMDDRGEPFAGASVTILGSGLATQSGVDGSYTLSLPAGSYTVEVSYLGHQTKRIAQVTVDAGQLTHLDLVLNPVTSTLDQVVVTGSYKRESIAGMYARQKNAASMTDGITAEQITRTPDNNVAQVLARVSGLNIQENKYVTVRGLSDRYNNVMLNGSQLPSTEPNKRNFAFDIIPSSIIDQVVVHKTATANLSGEFSGGIVEVETKSIPDHDFLRLKLGSGINTAATGSDFYQPQRGRRDFLAIDDNRRMAPGFDIHEYATLTFGDTDEQRRNELLGMFPNRFKLFNYRGAPIQDYDISIGRVADSRNDNRFGVIGAVTYRNEQTATEYLDQLLEGEFFSYTGQDYAFSTNWSAMLNAGYSFGGHKIGVKNIYSRKLAESSFIYHGPDLENEGSLYRGYANTPLENVVLQHRIEGEHRLRDGGLVLKWHGSVARTERIEPDNKNVLGLSRDSLRFRYVWQQDALTWGSLFYSTFQEDRYTWAAEADVPLRLFGRKQLFKGGYQASYRDAAFQAEMFAMQSRASFEGLPYYDAYAPEHIRVGAITYKPYLTNPGQGIGKTNGYDGFQRLNAGYLMVDGQLTQAIRFVAGIRAEHNLTANRSSQVAYVGDSPIRTDSLVKIDKIDWLPSATLIYSVSPKTNIRASYFGSVARPDLRELSFFTYYEAQRNTYVSGKDLKPTQIHNADLRFEYYPTPGEVVSVSGFYKRFVNPIELQLRDISGGGAKVAEMFYMNLDDATNLGVEVNFRKSLAFLDGGSSIWDYLFFAGNFTWMKSALTLGGGEDILREHLADGVLDGTVVRIPAQQSRPMWGQAPYLINGGLLYVGDRLGLNLGYTRVGERIVYGAQAARYNEWEKARDVLDAQVSFRFARQNRAEVKLNAADLINQPVIRYFNGSTLSEPDAQGVRTSALNDVRYDEGEDVLRRRFRYGRNFSLSLTYTF